MVQSGQVCAVGRVTVRCFSTACCISPGYEVPLEQIKQFRQMGSITPGHPEHGVDPGGGSNPGPLGQGFGNGVGMAIAEAHLVARYNQQGFDIVDRYTCGLVSDGDLMEGVAVGEAGSLAGQLAARQADLPFRRQPCDPLPRHEHRQQWDIAQRFQAYGWHTQSVADGERPGRHAECPGRRAEQDKASFAHPQSRAPTSATVLQTNRTPLRRTVLRWVWKRSSSTKQNLGWPAEPLFHIPQPALAHFQEALARGQQAEAEWQAHFSDYARNLPVLAQEYLQGMRGELPAGWDADIPVFPGDQRDENTRRLWKDHECDCTSPPVSFRRVGGPGPFDPYRAERCGRFRACRSRLGRHAGLERRRLEVSRPQPALWHSRAPGWERF